ncbi:MAG: DUF4435 domain-containing protein [Armatimonadota bacterium]|nr:DUF4435 domain-containing protein [Armatimonadota bacterium]
MPSVPYSTQGVNVLSKFHRKMVIYVEGPDDVPFWDEIFRLCGLDDYVVKPAGGVSVIEKYTQDILARGADIVVARDCDYTDLLRRQKSHVRVIYTYGYSIENTIYTPKNIASAISALMRAQQNHEVEGDVALWLDEFVEQFKELILYDIANDLCGKGVAVLGSKCCEFLEKDRSHLPSRDKIEAALNRLKSHFDEKEIEDVERLVRDSAKELRFVIRGHFLTHAVMNFIRNKTKSVSRATHGLSPDILVPMMILMLPASNKGRQDMEHLREQIEQLKAEVTKNRIPQAIS